MYESFSGTKVITSNLNIDKCNWIASSNLKAKIELTVKC